MIAYGICIGSEAKFSAYAVPGLARCVEADSPIAESRDNASIFSAYNEILDAFTAVDDLEALVLLHEDVELRDRHLPAKLRRRFAEPDVAVVGVIGARGVTSLTWWEGDGRGRCFETRGLIDFGGGDHDVGAVDGLLLALSPWAVRNLRFDAERYTGFHAYDMDVCFQARAAGRRVVVTEIDLMHRTKGGYGDVDAFRRSDATFRRKWARLFADRPTAPSQRR